MYEQAVGYFILIICLHWFYPEVFFTLDFLTILFLIMNTLWRSSKPYIKAYLINWRKKIKKSFLTVYNFFVTKILYLMSILKKKLKTIMNSDKNSK